MTQMEVVIQPSTAAAVELVARIIAREIGANPRAVLGLATGRTMESVYARLVSLHRNDGLDFSACRSFNLDEYVGLAGSDRHSYRHYMNVHFFNRVNIDLQNTHLPDVAASNLDAECTKYERLIEQNGGIDLQLLGIGASGHIGFNEPLSALNSRTRVVALAPATIQQNAALFGGEDKVPRRAITMGVATILESRQALLLATGKDKAEMIRQTIEGPLTNVISASALQLHKHCIIVLDRAAARALSKTEDYIQAYENDARWDWFRHLPAPVPAANITA